MDDLAAVWAYFAQHECGSYAPTYERICAAVAEDSAVLELVKQAPPRAHQPNVLLAAVRFVLLGGSGHPLGRVYAEGGADPWPPFRDFVLSHRKSLLEVMAVRRTQTNEVGRVAVLIPALEELRRRDGRPIALVDVGASAGLNMLLDRYAVRYGNSVVGPRDGDPLVECEVIGVAPPLPSAPLPITYRVGLDRSPVDIEDEDSRRWLEACIWPDHPGRAARLKRALRIALADPPTVLPGDAVDDVGALAADAPPDCLVCVVTTWALAYLSKSRRNAFAAALADCNRPIAWIAGEGRGVVPGVDGGEPPRHPGTDPSTLTLRIFGPDAGGGELLAWVHPHGAWIDWRG